MANNNSTQCESNASGSSSSNKQITTTQEKLNFVLNWLTEIYREELGHTTHGAQIPEFEQTERNISVLYELALHNIQQKKLFELKQNMVQQQMAQFRQKTSNLQNILKQCKLNITLLQQQHQTHLNNTSWSVASSPALFTANNYNSPGLNVTSMSSSTLLNSTTSASALSAMRVLAELAVLLDLKDTKTTSYMMAINDLMNDLDTVRQERIDIHQSSEELQARILSMLERIQKLERMNENMEKLITQHKNQDIIQARQMNVEYLKRKVVDYDSEIDRLRQKLEATLQTDGKEVDLDSELPRISQSAIMDIASELSTLKEKIEPKYHKLKTYQNLPPDMQAVRLKIAEARNELIRLDSLFQERAQSIWIE